MHGACGRVAVAYARGYVALAALVQDTANAFPCVFYARHEGRVGLASLKAAIATEQAHWILGGLLDER